MIELVYVSAAKRPFSPSELRELLAVARAHNTSVDVSGVLIHIEGSFLQVLEGEESEVEKLFEKIGGDPRHDKVAVLRRAAIEQRSFGEWSMGFEEVSGRDVTQLEGFTRVLHGQPLNVAAEGEHIRRIVDGFQQGKWRQA